MPESVVQVLLELCQPWYCDHSSDEPVPAPNHPLGEEPFPDIQTKPSPTQLHAVSSGPVIGHESEEISISPSASPYEDIEDINEVSPPSPPG